MKAVLTSVVCLMLLSCQGNTQDKVDLKTQKDSVSYSIGTDIGKNMKAQQIEINPQTLAKGIADAIAGGKMILTDQQIQECMTNFQRELVEKMHARAQEIGAKNKKEGDAFLASNKTKEGVKTTESGLQYKVGKMGDGPKPKADQSVVVNYKGTLLDGTEFDSSFKRGEPSTYPLTRLMKGWQEGLEMMPTGSKFTFYIPTELAYGAAGSGEAIPPNATLIFEVELVGIK